jgi:hypothetical protein
VLFLSARLDFQHFDQQGSLRQIHTVSRIIFNAFPSDLERTLPYKACEVFLLGNLAFPMKLEHHLPVVSAHHTAYGFCPSYCLIGTENTEL